MPSGKKAQSELRDLERNLEKYNRRVNALEQRKYELAHQLGQRSSGNLTNEGRRNETMLNENEERLPAKTKQNNPVTIKQNIEYTLKALRHWSLGMSQLMQKAAVGIDSLTAALSVMEVAGAQIQQQLEEATDQIKTQLANPNMTTTYQGGFPSGPAQSGIQPDQFNNKQMEMMMDVLKSPFFTKLLSQLQSNMPQQ